MLFGSTVLEVAIGVVFVYLLLSLLCSALGEMIEAVLHYRARNLERGISILLNDPARQGLAKDFFAHPLIKGLYQEGPRPSYIPARTFTLALWNMATTATTEAGAVAVGVTNNMAAIRATVGQLPNPDVRVALLTLIDEAGGDIDAARKNIEGWYDDAMDRASGWYKRRAQWILLALGLLVAIATNADSINIAQTLTHDSALRGVVVAAAEEAAKHPTTPGQTPAEQARAVRLELSSLGLPFGWVNRPQADDPRGLPDGAGWVLKVIGLLLTALAVSQGAPFWFDLLNKFVVVRSTVKPREKSREQPSKDKPAPETEVETGGGDEPDKA